MENIPNQAFSPDFNHIFSTFAMQALVAAGKVPDPVEQKTQVDLRAARYFVEVLGVLATKTEGNLTDEETKHVNATLHQVKLAFLEARDAAQEAAEQQGANQDDPLNREIE